MTTISYGIAGKEEITLRCIDTDAAGSVHYSLPRNRGDQCYTVYRFEATLDITDNQGDLMNLRLSKAILGLSLFLLMPAFVRAEVFWATFEDTGSASFAGTVTLDALVLGHSI